MLARYSTGGNGIGAPFTEVYTANIAATTDTSLTVPLVSTMGVPAQYQGQNILAILSYENAKDVWVAVNAAAAVPAGVAFLSSTSELKPNAKTVKAGDVIHFYCASTANISVAFYHLV